MKPSDDLRQKYLQIVNNLSHLLDELISLLEQEKEAVIAVNETKMLQIADKKTELIKHIKIIKQQKDDLSKNIDIQGLPRNVEKKLNVAKQKLEYNKKLLFTLYNTMGAIFERLNFINKEAGIYNTLGLKSRNSEGGILKKTWG